MRLIIFAIYLGIGALLHAAFVGPTFDWSSAWTFGWPLMLLITSWVIVIVGAVITGLIWCAYQWLDIYAKWRASKKQVKP